jgi:hypothetical protein
MYAQRTMPMLIAALVAVVGTTVILVGNFSSDQQSHASARQATDAAVSKAGAIETPTVTTY